MTSRASREPQANLDATDLASLERVAVELYHQVNFLYDIVACSKAVADSLAPIEHNALDENFARVNSELLHASETISSSCQQSFDTCDHIRELLETSTQAQGQIQETLTKLIEASQSIHSVADTIDRFSDQTKLLSLNARIEAARAGDAGRGFAVVAEEVNKLADAVGRESRSIREVIAELGKRTSAAKGLIEAEAVHINDQTKAVGSLVGLSQNLIELARQLPDLVTQLDQFLDPLERARGAISDNRMIGITAQNTTRNLHGVHGALRRCLAGDQQPVGGVGSVEEFIDRLRDSLVTGQQVHVATLLDGLMELGVGVKECLDAVGKAVQAANMRQKHQHVSIGDYYFNFLAVEEAIKHLDAQANSPCDTGMCVVLGNARGDYHSLGRHMVGLFLRISGVAVTDLGAGVEVPQYVEAVRQTSARVVGVSSLLVESAKEIRKLRAALDQAGKRDVKIVAGGACFVVDRDFGYEVGADYVATSASDMINIVQEVYRYEPLHDQHPRRHAA